MAKGSKSVPTSKSGGDPDPGADTGTKAGLGFGGSHEHALLVGVGRYANPAWSIPVTARDVESLSGVLTDPQSCGYSSERVRLLRHEAATKEGILKALDDLAGEVSGDPESTVVVYYSGHGWLDKEGRYFLVPHDVAPEDLTSTALPAERFIERLSQVRSRRLLVILDTCHAEGMATAKAAPPKGFSSKALPERLVQSLSEGGGRAVFTSCLGNQSSWILPDQSLSLFTHHFIEALKGAGSQPGDRVVRVSSLMRYVAETVPKSAQKLAQEQTPFFKMEAEDFPVALINGGEEIPTRTKKKNASDKRPQAMPATNRAGRDVISARDVGSLVTGATIQRKK